MSIPAIRCAAIAGLACLAAVPVHGEEMTLDQAVAQALTRHPGLQADRHAIDAVASEARLQALAPPLTIEGELENFAGTGALSGLRAAESTLRLSRVIELGHKQEARIALGTARIGRRRHAAMLNRIDVAAEVTRRFVAAAARQQDVAIAREDLVLVEQIRNTVAAWVESGRSPEADLRQAEIDVVRARLAVDDASHEFGSAKVALGAMWGDLEPGFATVAADLASLPAVAEFAAYAARLPGSASQQAFALDAEAVQAQRQVAMSGARPDVSLSLGMRRFEAFDDEALVFGVSVPLGSAERSALGVERYSAELASIDAQREAARLEAQRRLFALYQGMQHARHVFDTHRDDMIPKAESALALVRRNYELGRASFLALAEALRVVVELRHAEVAAAARFHTLLVDVERLTAATEAVP